jgi:TfoX/Sxy family transcriptional regulator of competence genes
MDYVCDQIADAGVIRYRKMFGEFAVYCDDKVVALVCDNQFFLKPTTSTQALLENCAMAPPYPGAKPYFVLHDELEDRARVVQAVRLTALEVPAPKPKRAKVKKKTDSMS